MVRGLKKVTRGGLHLQQPTSEGGPLERSMDGGGVGDGAIDDGVGRAWQVEEGTGISAKVRESTWYCPGNSKQPSFPSGTATRAEADARQSQAKTG